MVCSCCMLNNVALEVRSRDPCSTCAVLVSRPHPLCYIEHTALQTMYHAINITIILWALVLTEASYMSATSILSVITSVSICSSDSSSESSLVLVSVESSSRLWSWTLTQLLHSHPAPQLCPLLKQLHFCSCSQFYRCILCLGSPK